MQAAAVAPWDLKQKHSALLEFVHIVPPGVTLETALSSSYWRNAWKVLEGKKYSTIDLLADDGSFDVTVRILDATATSMEFRVVREWEPKRAPGRKPNVPNGYTVEHLPDQGWRAVAPDGTVLIEKKASEDDALKAALNHARKASA